VKICEDSCAAARLAAPDLLKMPKVTSIDQSKPTSAVPLRMAEVLRRSGAPKNSSSETLRRSTTSSLPPVAVLIFCGKSLPKLPIRGVPADYPALPRCSGTAWGFVCLLQAYSTSEAGTPVTMFMVTSILPRVALEYGGYDAASISSSVTCRSTPGRLTFRRAARP
jgi:hypothetical protein